MTLERFSPSSLILATTSRSTFSRGAWAEAAEPNPHPMESSAKAVARTARIGYSNESSQWSRGDDMSTIHRAAHCSKLFSSILQCEFCPQHEPETAPPPRTCQHAPNERAATGGLQISRAMDISGPSRVQPRLVVR